MKTLLLILALVLGLPPVARAATEIALMGKTHVSIGTRVFDIGQEPRDYYSEEGFIPLDRIKWLQALMAEDPLFERGVFHIILHPSQSAEFLWEDATRGGKRTLLSSPPPDFAHPDYDHSARLDLDPFQFQVLLTQKIENKDHSVFCIKDPVSGEILFCALLSSYPPDPRLYLQMRIYGHGPVPARKHSYSDMANRMREIVYCLDVTNAFDPSAPSRFAGQAFKDMDEFLTFCRKTPTS